MRFILLKYRSLTLPGDGQHQHSTGGWSELLLYDVSGWLSIRAGLSLYYPTIYDKS